MHVELGSGDGRLNFHAIDHPFSVKKSTGIDIDEDLIKIADDRLSKRFPVPNVKFIKADLERSDAYESIFKDATVITMYFVDHALRKIQPKLVEAVKGRDVRIVTCGYPMPGWDPTWVEVVLGLSVHLYDLKANQDIPLAHYDMKSLEDAADNIEGEDLKPVHQDEDAGVESIPVPLFDPEEKIDGHWDVFGDDNEEIGPEDDNPLVERYRQLSLKIGKKKK